MDNNINNFNYFKQELQANLAEFIRKQNSLEDQTTYKLFQFGRDLIKIFVSKNQFLCERYCFETQFSQCQDSGTITLIDTLNKTMEFDFQQFTKFDFDVQIKGGIMYLEIKESKKTIYVFLGSAGFPCLELHQLNVKIEAKFSFNHQLQRVCYEQIEFHPNILGLLLFLVNKLDNQYFCMYHYTRNGIVCLFEKKTLEIMQNRAVNFSVDYINQCNINITDIFGHTFSIDFSAILKPLNHDLKQQCIQSKKTQFFNYRDMQFEVFNFKQNWRSYGKVLYFEKIPINDENIFIYFTSDEESLSLEISIIQTNLIFQEKIDSIIKKDNQPDWSKMILDPIEIKVKPIKQYNPIISSLYYYCNETIIVVDISEPFSIKSYKLQADEDVETSIEQVVLIDYCYVKGLILQIETNNKKQLIELYCDQLEHPKSLKVEDNAKNKIHSYFQSKQTLEEIRSFLVREKQLIAEESDLTKLTNCEGKIYNEVQKELNPIIKLVQKEFKGQKLKNNLQVLKLYKQFNDLYHILNSHDYEENEQKVILSQYNLKSINQQQNLQQNAYNQIQSELEQCQKQDEQKLRQLLINSIIEKAAKLETI